MSWAQAKTQVVHISISPHPSIGGTAEPGAEPHVGVGYQVVLPPDRGVHSAGIDQHGRPVPPPGRVVHSAGLTLHGPATQDRALPRELAEAVKALWAYAEGQVAEYEGVKLPTDQTQIEGV